jgi:hypothetical protein
MHTIATSHDALPSLPASSSAESLQSPESEAADDDATEPTMSFLQPTTRFCQSSSEWDAYLESRPC